MIVCSARSHSLILDRSVLPARIRDRSAQCRMPQHLRKFRHRIYASNRSRMSEGRTSAGRPPRPLRTASRSWDRGFEVSVMFLSRPKNAMSVLDFG
jgi:hypothetical protein